MSSSSGVETPLAVSLSDSVSHIPSDDAGSSQNGGSDRASGDVDVDSFPVDQKPTLLTLQNYEPSEVDQKTSLFYLPNYQTLETVEEHLDGVEVL